MVLSMSFENLKVVNLHVLQSKVRPLEAVDHELPEVHTEKPAAHLSSGFRARPVQTHRTCSSLSVSDMYIFKMPSQLQHSASYFMMGPMSSGSQLLFVLDSSSTLILI